MEDVALLSIASFLLPIVRLTGIEPAYKDLESPALNRYAIVP